MICTTIQNKTAEQILEALDMCEMAEIRLDRCDLSAREMEAVFSSDVPLVATCRISGIAAADPSLQELPEQSREVKAMQIAERRLIRAIEAGARYVDVEIEASKPMAKRVRSAAHENGTVFIRSYHDFEATDSLEALKAVVEKCLYHGADMVKVVTMAHAPEDVERVMALYAWCREEVAAHGGKSRKDERHAGELAGGGLIAFCMGEAGKESRLRALKEGAPFTYAALSSEDAAAPGQWPADEMKKAVYGNFRFTDMESPLKMPVSKSFAQRAIIAAALAEGTSHLRGYTPCGDNEAALQVARALGAQVEQDGAEITITGISASLGSLGTNVSADKDSDALESRTLHVGESGLLTRMMIPVMVQLCPGKVILTGEKTLLGRPLTGAKAILETFGAECRSIDGTDARDLCIPLEVSGPLKAGRAEVSGKHGSQIISGLLMALPFADRNSSLIVHEPKSIPYTFITLEVLKKFGVKVGNDMLGGRDFLESGGDWSLCTEMVFKIKGGQKYKAADIDLEADWSAAANFLVAGAIFGKLEIQGLDTTSLQADLSIMDVLMDAGASLSQMDGNNGDITVQRAPLTAFQVDASNCPDLFPVLSVLAAFCHGTSRLAGVSRLANKESDRAKAILEMLTRMGVKASIEADELVVEGQTLVQRLLDGNLLKGGSYTSHHDHRMVMALKVASLGADSPITIDDEACVAKSFPQFLDIWQSMTCSR